MTPHDLYLQNGMKIFADRVPFFAGDGVNIRIMNIDGARRDIATNVEFEQIEEGRCYDPLFTLDPTHGQALMDMLWDCGIRPAQGKGSAGSLQATENHLKDMRRIAFNQLRMDA